ncbi:hypothetical protein MIMGU_mgv1a000477mg [Erythranthe guttata]|uniref:Protein kinase domain-containing protein n=1 Tax=Erythranthe guttata TaxID=4155 RepID=A0A022RZ14_ERYGU|nr:hypothetical protein MIMGU_mgv1a000477mg [Erythranthe guttata]
MYISESSKNFLIFSLFLHILIIPATYSLDSIAISCGSSGNSTALDGRIWIGDSTPKSTFSPQINGKTSESRTTDKLASLDSVPYKTARASRHEFTYVFQVNPGQKFIRLHFYRDSSYKGFESSKALFTVKAGPYTLLSNFSTSLISDVSGEKQILKEYCVNVDESRALTLTFSPAQKERKSDDFYAFVNAIEVVSMPTGLYFTPEGELGALVVGQKYRFYIDNTTAFELVRRLNVGGTTISPAEDSRMFRRWDEDSTYLMEAGSFPVETLTTVGYRGTSTHVAPIKVYDTARTMQTVTTNNLTWRIPVDLGFRYLTRLHFSELHPRIAQQFSIFINNQIAENDANIIQRGGESGVAVYRDYIVMMDGDKTEGKRHLSITFQAKIESTYRQFNGLEVFKLSNPDNNLAGMGPVLELQSSTSTPQQKKPKSIYSSNMIAALLTVILALLNIAVYHLRIISETNSGTRNIRSSTMEPRCRRFPIDEIRLATNYFDLRFHIGSGGYGRVYKGSIDGGATVVAIKRLKSESRQGDTEFWTEIKMLSKIRHKHLVSLIGYCNDGQERVLVYHYMAQGTLSDHIYKTYRHGKSNPPLSWELRLKASIGAARGLYYLHSRHRVIHRDVKSSNILLDENWVAKISDFGLSKMGPTNDSFTHISTNVKGTFGYLDPEYFLTRKLTRKSDVYAFGVVLFEVLSGRPAVEIRLEEEKHSLAGWARYCIREGRVDQLIDQNLTGQILPACLKVFVGIAGRCLHTQPQGRPAMADVVMGLELALALQQSTDPMEEEENIGRTDSDRNNPSSSTRIRGRDQKNPKLKTKDSSSATNSTHKWWWDPFGILPRTPSKPKASPQAVIHHFSIQEIQTATNDFHNSLVIGFGGADNVYKGCINGGQKLVAIRQSRTRESRLCMSRELQSQKETQTKSSPSQKHVVSLIGYCETESDMVLVYEYMPNGTLYDHLHEPLKSPLPWKRRLQICIGAARGLIYIHSTIKQTVLHRDFKSTNIWLDENFVPKVSEWDYIRGEESTEKSYVYSFGLVLFELLFDNKESDRWLDEDQVSLAQWIKSCMRNNLSGCIDPFLVGRVSPDSLRIFVETAGRCLLDHGNRRPSMNDIVTQLEAALEQQEVTEGKVLNS